MRRGDCGRQAPYGDPVAILTNGSLLWQPDVRASLVGADLVLPSLDAGDAGTFRTVNRPHPELDFDEMVEGLVTFGEDFRRPVWLEVFLVKGLNSGETQVRAIAAHAAHIRPERVQLNTVARPPAEPGVSGLSECELQQCAGLFEGLVEVIADYPTSMYPPRQQGGENAIVAMIRRRPCTVQDISAALGLHVNEVVKHLEHLQRQDRVTRTPVTGRGYQMLSGPARGRRRLARSGIMPLLHTTDQPRKTTCRVPLSP